MDFRCSHCGTPLSADGSLAGQPVKCWACQKTTLAPPPEADAPTAAAATPPPGASDVTIRDPTPPPRTAGSVPRSGGRVRCDELTEGQVLGKCRIERELGRGGMGAVFLARHTKLDVPVAVKVLPPDVMEENPAFVRRFLQEAQLAARIRHPNVVAVMDVDQDPATGLYYIVQEFVGGGTVRDLLKKGPLPVERALQIATETAAALVAAARHNIIHRDIKPDNIMLTEDGHAKLADLGLAKDLATETNVTMSAMMMGTPAYMPPEQIEDARSADARADIYSLGATLYQMLVGDLPFKGDTAINVISKVIHAPTPDPRGHRPEVPAAVATVCMKAMAKNRDERYPSAAEFLADLERLREGRAPSAGPDAPAERVAPTTPARNANLPVRSIVAAVVILLVLISVGRRGRERHPPEPVANAPAAPPTAPAVAAPAAAPTAAPLSRPVDQTPPAEAVVSRPEPFPTGEATEPRLPSRRPSAVGPRPVRPPPPEPEPVLPRSPDDPFVEVQTPRVRAGDPIVTRVRNFKAENKGAWIGFYEDGAPSEKYIHYTFINNLIDDTFDLRAPRRPGRYRVRVFSDSGYAPVAESPPILVTE